MNLVEVCSRRAELCCHITSQIKTKMTDKYQDGEVRIRKAVKEDMVTVHRMIRELANFLQIPDPPKLSCKELERDGFETQPPLFVCLIAEFRNGTAAEDAGYLMCHPSYSAWRGRTMFLENFYVDEKYRRRGIGEKLFGALAKEVFSTGCSSINFTVAAPTEAPLFYNRQGATNLTESVQLCAYSLGEEALRNLARNAGAE